MEEKNELELNSTVVQYDKVKVGDIITFGRYPHNEDGQDKTPIEWRVLAKEDNKMLVISEYALDCKQYNTTYTGVTWGTCSLRKWMNGTFLNNAFSAEEQAQIQSTNVPADENPKFSTDPGNDTTDKVFLLSIAEAAKYFTSDEDRKCIPTAYAVARGAWANSNYTKGGKSTCWWWLRSPGDDQDCAANVNRDGSVDCYGGYVIYGGVCVRPALWIKPDSISLTQTRRNLNGYGINE